MINIHYLKAFNDNYIWLIKRNLDVVVVDPGVDKSVLDYIIANKLNLVAILLTHSHADHIGGVASITSQFPVPVYGYCDIATNKVNQGNSFELLGCQINVIYNPGHTMDGVSYLVHDEAKRHLFCGDTLFAAGCGRVFTEDYALMLNSLEKLAKLDSSTLVYPGHEYTLKNLGFANWLEPDNSIVNARIASEENKLNTLGITLPTTVNLELQTNPFLRLNDESLKKSIATLSSLNPSTKLDYFISLRKLRNNF
jgi:hydroxyacylglutathione hydrolase